MQMHAIQTALIDVKTRYYDAGDKNRSLRLGSVLLDRQFMRIPVYAWVIEHPEGLIVIDTGETANVNKPDFFPLLQRPYWLSQYRFYINPEDELGAQMRERGLPPEEVRWVVLTHTHFDHTDALYHFPNAKFIISEKEYSDVSRFRSAHFAFPSKWPGWFKPHVIRYFPEAIGPFEQSYALTEDGTVQIVPTPGHTLGHQSVIVEDEGLSYFFGGDSSFDLKSLLNETIDAPAFDENKVLETRRRILDFADDRPTVYLTTHDFKTEERLKQRIILSRQQIEQGIAESSQHMR
jgi:N-acyl homoserine lactone hydrolase